ncbi:MAG: histidine phosphatase family protein [Nostoc sp. ChiSLP01]|nr:histidine phosphatase family protein [Nostoc sp. CmiSLP01]MDZ8282372.1 histidine phosphatase family protein [Nostoc sp. ChiSLP01]
MQRLILVRHSLPKKIEHIPAKEWRLSLEGQEGCHLLADKLADFQPGIIATSREPKAIETAQIIAQKFNMAVEIVEGLHEHDRSNFGFVEEKKFFETLEAFFATPDKLVMGLETANQAHQRFQQAIKNILAKTPNGDAIVVSHGTVMTLFVAGCTGKDAFPFWRQLGQPMAIALPLPELNSLEIIANY